jgi:hypothetical protein
MKNILIVWIALFLLGCQATPGTEPTGTSETRFRTTDPSRLYFKNIRSTSYAELASPQEGVEVFRLRRMEPAEDRPMLMPKILNNWMEDEAYVFLETNAYPSGFARPLSVKWKTMQDSGQLVLSKPTPADQRAMADSLYLLLGEKADFWIKDGEDQWISLWGDNTDRTSFATTLRDYYRLVEVD